MINECFFNEFTIRTPQAADELIEALAKKGVIGGLPVSRLLPDAGPRRSHRRGEHGNEFGRGSRAPTPPSSRECLSTL